MINKDIHKFEREYIGFLLLFLGFVFGLIFSLSIFFILIIGGLL